MCRTGAVHDFAEVAARDERQRRSIDPEPCGPRTDLLERFFPRGEEAGVPGSRQARDEVEEERRLADAGLARQEDDRAGDEAPAEDSIDACEAGTDAGRGVTPGLQGRDGRAAGGPRSGGMGTLRDRSPRPARRAPPGPLRRRLAALGAREERPYPSHTATLAGGYDI